MQRLVQLIKESRIEDKKSFADYLSQGDYPFNYEEQLVKKHRDCIDKILGGGIIPPLHFEFLPTEKCNNECIWCRGGHRSYMSSEKELSEIDMLKVVDDIADYGVPGIVRFSGMCGEPLMNSGTVKAISRGVGKGLNVGLITNGILLDENVYEYLLGTAYVSTSLDAGTRETFNDLKGHNRNSNIFEKILKNIEDLVLFKEAENENFRVSVGYVLHPKNYSEVVEATKRVKEAGVDFIQFKIPFAVSQLQFSREDIQKIYSLIDEAKKLTDSRFEVRVMQEKEEGIRELSGEVPIPNFKNCFAQFLNGVVSADGNVYPCVHFTYNGKTISGQPFGNIRKESFRSIWEGAKRKRMLKMLIPAHDCSLCNRYDHRVNGFINFLNENGIPDIT